MRAIDLLSALFPCDTNYPILPAMSIVTGKGDDGTTGLLFGQRVSKADLVIELSGTLDELNAFLGSARYHAPHPEVKSTLEKIQRELFVIGADISVPPEDSHKKKTQLTTTELSDLDQAIQKTEAIPGILDDWAIPGATLFGSTLDIARATVRRAERNAVRLNASTALNPLVLQYLNRLSDFLWLLTREHEMEQGISSALRE